MRERAVQFCLAGRGRFNSVDGSGEPNGPVTGEIVKASGGIRRDPNTMCRSGGTADAPRLERDDRKIM